MDSTPPSILGELAVAIGQLRFARDYVQTLLEEVPPDAWFVMPAGLPTHLAWQVGHLAMAEYGLTLLRPRGKLPEDAAFIDNDFMRTFRKGSQPSSDPGAYPSPEVIRRTFDRVHQEALKALPTYSATTLAESVEMPYSVYPNKLGSIMFCAAHEMLHAGQIGLIRRALGKLPVR